MTIPLITVVLDPPEIADPANFEAKADDTLNTGLVELTDQINDVVDGMNDLAGDLNTVFNGAGFVSTSTTSLTIGSGAKSLDIATGLQLAPGMHITAAVTASSALNSMFGTVTAYNSGTGDLDFTVEADDVKGSGTYSTWTVSLSGPKGEDATLKLTPEARTSNTAMTPADSGKSIEATGTFTQTYNAAATLGSGWFQPITNRGTGVITLALATNELLQPGETSFITCDGSTLKSIKVVTDLGPHVLVQDQKTAGTDGGSAAPGNTWLTRTLNTVLRNIAGAVVSSNQVQLGAGTWRLEAWALANNSAGNPSRLRIQNITDSTTAALGEGAIHSSALVTRNTAFGIVIITSAKTFEVQHKKNSAASATDFGVPVSNGDVEIYCEFRATRIADA